MSLRHESKKSPLPARNTSLAFLVFTILFFLGFQTSVYAKPLELFMEGAVSVMREIKQEPWVKRGRYVEAKFHLLYEPKVPSISPPEISESRILLNLFEDVSIQAVKDHIEIRSDTRYTWFGHVEGVPGSGRNYQIRPVGGNLQVIYEVDESLFPPHEDPITPSLKTGPIVLPKTWTRG